MAQSQQRRTERISKGNRQNWEGRLWGRALQEEMGPRSTFYSIELVENAQPSFALYANFQLSSEAHLRRVAINEGAQHRHVVGDVHALHSHLAHNLLDRKRGHTIALRKLHFMLCKHLQLLVSCISKI